MRRSVKVTLLVLAFGLVLPTPFSEASKLPIDADTPGGNPTRSDSRTDITRVPLRFELSMIDNDIVQEFAKAWTISSNGTSGKEGVVLIFKSITGGYQGRVQRSTNEMRQVTFTWVSNAIAVVHTHPNKNDPRPSIMDRQLADRFNVPMITITLRGMYVYDPATKETKRVFDGLDWLDSNKWGKRT